MNEEKRLRQGLKCHKEGKCADASGNFCPYFGNENCVKVLMDDALSALGKKKQEEQKDIVGIRQTVEGITFFAMGTAKEAQERGVMLGKAYMLDWLKKELYRRDLLTNDIRSVFEEANGKL